MQDQAGALGAEALSGKVDDASIAVLMKALDNQELKGRLTEKDRRWRGAMLSRSSDYPDASSNISTLIERWERLQGEGDSTRRVRHLRNKKLGHVTIGCKSEVSASPTVGYRDGHGSVVGIFALVPGTVGVLGANAASHSTSAENAIRKSRLCRRIDANTIKVV
ncbi:hypothetical protein [Nitrobacter sp.]|uniref:hypothetical protein n=1 Tax=Nitrobacter sp. TaxID=29420 RepID=UPI003F64E114